MTRSVDAIFSDMGDVLVRIVPDRFFTRLAEHVPDLDREAFIKRVLARDVYMDFARGLIDARGFCLEVGRILGVEWSFETFRDVWIDMMDDIPGMERDFARALAHVPVHVLSNTDPVHVEHIRERFPWIREASGWILSCEVGLLKPDPRFYTVALERTGLDPGRVVFIDDRAENVEAAARLGLECVHATDPGAFGRLVEDLFGVSPG
jgi:putative hydrolase of the HAD superfamily